MPSDSGRRLAWLRSQGLGLVCGFTTVALLAVGSFVLAGTRDGASAGIGMDDLRGFFEPPRLAHLWLYLLFPVVGLYAVNTTLATWDSVVRKWRRGARAPAAYGAAVVHAGFLIALVGHAVGGFLGRDLGSVLVTSSWQPLPGFGEVRLVSLEVDPLPDGTPREAWATLEVRREGSVRTERVGYDAPLSSRGGARLALLGELGDAWVVRLASGRASCSLAEGQSCRIGGQEVRLLGLGRGRGGAAALIEARGPSGGVETRWLDGDGELALAGGRPLQLSGAAPEKAVLLRAREAPGNPWALGAAVVLGAGVLLLWRRLASPMVTMPDRVDPGSGAARGGPTTS